MVKTKTNWTSPTGEQFLFEYEVTRNPYASSVKDVSGTIRHLAPSKAEAADGGGGPDRKRRKGNGEVVGRLVGHEIRRGANGNKLFHDHADCVGGELRRMATSLYDYRGEMCRAPRGSPIRDIYHMDGSVLLLEIVEIRRRFKGVDLGINFVHGFLSWSDVSRRVGVAVMYPWTLTCSALRYDDNIQLMRESEAGKSESEKVDVRRRVTVKLRRQFSRIGFRAVADTPDWVDTWWMSMGNYRTKTPADVQRAWLSNEEAAGLDIPMPVKKHVNSEKDEELKELLSSLMPCPMSDPYAAQMNQLSQQVGELQQMVSGITSILGNNRSSSNIDRTFERLNEIVGRAPDGGSKLTDEKRADMKRLVDEGADLRGINALHLASSRYKENDLFDLLVDEYGLGVDDFDDIGRRPIHVAAVCDNADALRILIEKGADKKGKSREGKTALEEVNGAQRHMDDFTRAMFGGVGLGGGVSHQVRSLLA